MSQIHGHCDPAFRDVQNAFEANFTDRGEVGASVCIKDDKGRTLVDLWGGTHADGTTPWTRDTISIVFSCTKAATALCAQILIDRGQLDLHALVTDYWPEFGANGKEMTTVRDMLSHRSGVPALRATVPPDGYLDFDYMVEQLATETPFWEPGTAHGYHMVTFGWTVGELVQRVSGKSLGTFFRDEIAKPLGLDFHIGLPQSEFGRMSKLIPYRFEPNVPPSAFVRAMIANRGGMQALAYANDGGWSGNESKNWSGEVGGAGGAGNARALAGMFSALIGADRILSPERIADMATLQSEGDDLTLMIPTRFGQGFMLSTDNRDLKGEGNSVIIGDAAFGHVGMGGSIGFVDPDSKFSFGYTMNKMGGGILLNDRGQSLVDAAYRCA